MVLIAILICLALQRFANVGGWFQPSWFEFYLKSLSQWLKKLNEWVAILLIITPVVLFLFVLHMLFGRWFFGLFNLILAVAVLFFCIDARDYKNKLTSYFTNLEKGDTTAAALEVGGFIDGAAVNNSAELSRAVTRAILGDSFAHIFAGLFWFMLFGSYGVTVYFLIVLICQNAVKISSDFSGIAKLAAQIQEMLDWVPARLTGLSYSLAGNFSKGFNFWSKNLWSGLSETKSFAVAAGVASLDIDPDATKAVIKENYAVLDLINHTLAIWLIALALVLLGIWL